MLAVAVVWGATFPTAKHLLEFLPPFVYLAVRFAVAGSVLLPLGWDGLVRAPAAVWARGGAAGLALGAGYALQTLGLRHAPATNAAFLTGLFVVLVPALGALWGRRPTPWEWAGVVAGTAGLALLTGGGVRMEAAEVLLVGCAACFALHILLLDAVAARLPPTSSGALQMAVAGGLTGALAIREGLPAGVPAEVWAAVAAMGLFASAAAFSVQSWAQRFTPPTHVGLVFTAEPVAAALLAWWWLGERLTPGQWVGGGLILAGMMLAQLGGQPGRAAPEAVAGR